MQHDILADDVVPEAVVAGTNAPLAFTVRNIVELLDGMLSRSIVRVCSKDGDYCLEGGDKVGMLLQKLPNLPFVGWCDEDAEGGGHGNGLFCRRNGSRLGGKFTQKIVCRSHITARVICCAYA